MNNWWQKWAEVVAQALAEQWLESRTKKETGDQSHSPESDPPEAIPDVGEMGHTSTTSQDTDDDA